MVKPFIYRCFTKKFLSIWTAILKDNEIKDLRNVG